MSAGVLTLAKTIGLVDGYIWQSLDIAMIVFVGMGATWNRRTRYAGLGWVLGVAGLIVYVAIRLLA